MFTDLFAGIPTIGSAVLDAGAMQIPRDIVAFPQIRYAGAGWDTSESTILVAPTLLQVAITGGREQKLHVYELWYGVCATGGSSGGGRRQCHVNRVKLSSVLPFFFLVLSPGVGNSFKSQLSDVVASTVSHAQTGSALL